LGGNNVIQSSRLRLGFATGSASGFSHMLRAVATANCILFAALAAFGQTETPLAFEVASVKPNTSGSGSSRTSGTTGQLTITNRSLKELIAMAYSVQDFQLAGPEWLGSVKFDIVAKIPAGARRDQNPAMMQALLAERFHLAVHRESKEMPAYALVVGKSGPKLQQVEPGGTNMNNNGNNNSRQITAERVSMAALAETLARIVEHPVVDRTALQGVYKLKLEYAPDNAKSDGPDGAAGPSIYTALQEQLGLKLQTQKLPVEIVVVDRVERVPTEN
jgi:uncharacterized protein (TIGR03435 family)